MNSSKREKTPWTKFRKKHGPKKREDGEYLFDESRRKEQSLPERIHGSDHVFWIALG